MLNWNVEDILNSLQGWKNYWNVEGKEDQGVLFQKLLQKFSTNWNVEGKEEHKNPPQTDMWKIISYWNTFMKGQLKCGWYQIHSNCKCQVFHNTTLNIKGKTKIFSSLHYFKMYSFIVRGLWMNRLPHFPAKYWISFHTKSGSYLQDYTPL